MIFQKLKKMSQNKGVKSKDSTNDDHEMYFLELMGMRNQYYKNDLNSRTCGKNIATFSF